MQHCISHMWCSFLNILIHLINHSIYLYVFSIEFYNHLLEKEKNKSNWKDWEHRGVELPKWGLKRPPVRWAEIFKQISAWITDEEQKNLLPFVLQQSKTQPQHNKLLCAIVTFIIRHKRSEGHEKPFSRWISHSLDKIRTPSFDLRTLVCKLMEDRRAQIAEAHEAAIWFYFSSH